MYWIMPNLEKSTQKEAKSQERKKKDQFFLQDRKFISTNFRQQNHEVMQFFLQ